MWEFFFMESYDDHRSLGEGGNRNYPINLHNTSINGGFTLSSNSGHPRNDGNVNGET